MNDVRIKNRNADWVPPSPKRVSPGQAKAAWDAVLEARTEIEIAASWACRMLRLPDCRDLAQEIGTGIAFRAALKCRPDLLPEDAIKRALRKRLRPCLANHREYDHKAISYTRWKESVRFRGDDARAYEPIDDRDSPSVIDGEWLLERVEHLAARGSRKFRHLLEWCRGVSAREMSRRKGEICESNIHEDIRKAKLELIELARNARIL